MAEMMSRGIEFSAPEYPVAANTLIEAGDMVAIDRATGASKGYAVPASAAANKAVRGVARTTVDNRTGNAYGNSGLAGGAKVVVELSYGDKGLRAYKLNNDTGTPIAQADVGGTAYVKTSKSVTGDSTGTSAAGEVFRVESDGVFVIFNA